MSNDAARRAWLAGMIVALLAGIALLLGVELRAWRLASRPIVQFLFRAHDVGLVAEGLLLIPFSIALSRLTSSTRRSGIASVVAVSALLAISLSSLFQLLGILRYGPDTWYMLPQGVLGLWVLAISRRVRASHPGLYWLGILAGAGLVLIAASFTLPLVYFGPRAMSGRIETITSTGQLLNRVAHYGLRIGSYPGLLGLPAWGLAVGRRLK